MSTYRVWFIQKVYKHALFPRYGKIWSHSLRHRSKIFFAYIQLYGCIVLPERYLMQAENNLTIASLPNTKDFTTNLVDPASVLADFRYQNSKACLDYIKTINVMNFSGAALSSIVLYTYRKDEIRYFDISIFWKQPEDVLIINCILNYLLGIPWVFIVCFSWETSVLNFGLDKLMAIILFKL